MPRADELAAVTPAFVDALVGLASVCDRFERMRDDGSIAALTAMNPEWADAAVGACSLAATVRQMISAMAGEATVRSEPEPPAAWKRDHLR